MALQILVNHYNEDRDTVRRFLSSLDMQTYRDFSVMILSDGGVRLSEDDLSGFKFPIEYAYKPHTGVCNTRNVMLDRATAEWVMFCDIDDCFVADGLGKLMACVYDYDYDIVGATYLSEGPDGEVTPMRNDTIRVHAKAFRRQYLIDNQIRFPDELETSGDMAFLWLAFSMTEKIRWIDEPFYTWKWNPSSVTRTDPYFKATHYDRTLACYMWLVADLRRRGRRNLLERLVPTVMAMMYVDATSSTWQYYPTDARRHAESHMSRCIAELMPDYEAIDGSDKRMAYNTMRNYVNGDCGGFDLMEPWLMSMTGNVLIVGHGTVGTNVDKELSVLDPIFCDKYKNEPAVGHYRFAFICVDTPYTEDDPCDITEVENALMENDADIYVIKSTVLPGTTRQLSMLTGKRIVFSPEYYGGTQHANASDYNFTILGGDKDDCIEVVQLLQDVYDGSHQFRITDSTTAELTKYAENSWIATKVSFCVQMYHIAESLDVQYEELRELFVLDPRVNPSHTYSYRSHPFWDSHCLNKDVPAIAKHANAPLLDSVIAFNEVCKRNQSER
jgi:hypothetical protein